MALTVVTVPAGGQIQLDDGTHVSVYVQNQGQRHVNIEPLGQTLRPTQSGTFTITAGVPLYAEAVGDTTIGYQVSSQTQPAASGSAGSPAVTTVSSSGASQTLTLPASTDACFDVTLSANCTFTLTGGTAGKLGTITVILRQDGTAGRTTTFPTSVNWPSQTAPTFNTAAGKYDVVQVSTPDGGTTWFGGLVASAVQPITSPAAPVSLAANPSSTQNVLTWADAGTGGSPITGHTVYRATTSGAETSLATVGNVLTYTDTSLTNGTIYYYTVAAGNAFGAGSQSAETASAPGHYLSVATTGGMSTPNIAGMTPGTSTVDLRARIQMANWVPSGNNFILTKWHATAANNQYALYVDNAGKLNGAWYNAAGVFQGSASTVATNQPANGTKWVRALLNPGAGTITYYLSDDGTTWTQLGTTISGLTTTAVQTPTTAQPLTAGQTASATGQFVGKIFRGMLIVNGTTIADADVSTQTPAAGTFTGGQGLTWTVISAAAIV